MYTKSQPGPGTLEAEFRRFRDDDDIAALGRVFEEASPRLLALAARVSGDGAEAEDLVQATFLKALTDRDRWDESRPLMPWLVGILVHRAQDSGRRRQVRRASPLVDGDHLQDAGADPASVAAYEDDYQAVLQAVDQLDEPYRELLFLRIRRGFDTSDIATELGRSAATIRVQLSRGRERLGRILPKELRLTAVLLVDRDLVLERIRRHVLDPEVAARVVARSGGPALVKSGAASAAGWTGAKLAMCVAAALLAMLSAWMFMGDEEAFPSPTPAVEMASVPAAEDPALLGLDGAAAQGRAGREEVPSVPEVAPLNSAPALRIQVAYGEGDEETVAAGVGVYIRHLDERRLGISGVTDDAGNVDFAGIAPGRYGVTLGPSDAAPVEILVDQSRNLSLSIAKGVEVTGRVLDYNSTPVGGADVYRLNAFHHDAAQWVATTGPSGSYRAAHVDPDARLFVRASGHQPAGGKRSDAFRAVSGRAGSSQTVDLRLGSSGHSINGQVLGPDGQPAPFARVVVAVNEDARKFANGLSRRLGDPGGDPGGDDEDGGLDDTDSFILRADAEGFFRSDEVPCGTAALLASSWDDRSLIGTTTIYVQAGGVTGARLLLAPGAEVFGRAVDESGAPRAGIHLACEWGGSHELGEFESGFGEEAFRGYAVTAADGSYRMVGLLPGDTKLMLVDALGESLRRERAELEVGEALEWNPVINFGPGIRVLATGADDEPLVGWRVCCDRDKGSISRRDSLVTDGEGRAHFMGLKEDSYVVTLHAPDGVGAGTEWIPTAYQDDRTPGEDVVFRYDAAAASEVSGTIKLAASEGTPAQGGRVQLLHLGFDDLGRRELPPTGEFAFGPLAPGDYRILVTAASAGVPQNREVAAFTLAPGETLDLGTLVPESGTVLVLDVSGSEHESPERRSMSLTFKGESVGYADTFRIRRSSGTGKWRSEPLAAGVYEVTYDGWGLPQQRRTVEVSGHPGDQHESWEAQRGEPVELVVHFGNEPALQDVQARCEPGEGRVNLDLSLWKGDGSWHQRITRPYDLGGTRTFTLPCTMAPGTYKLIAQDERFDGWEKPRAVVKIVVVAGQPLRVDVRLDGA